VAIICDLGASGIVKIWNQPRRISVTTDYLSLRVAFCVVVVCNGEPSNGSGKGNGDGAVQFRRSAAAVAVQCVVSEERGLTWESSPASWPWQQRAHGSWVGRLVRGSKGKRNEEGSRGM
jgi:hypothetical protein